MKPEHAIALIVIPVLTVVACAAATWFQRVRDLFFFAMVTLAVFAERTDVNFFSQAWYRGTTRGIQVTLLEILAFALLIGCWLGPSRDERETEERRWFWPASLGVMLLYLLYAIVCVAASEPKIYGIFEISKMLGGILVFVAAAAYVRTKREWTLLLVALGCVVGFEGLWAMKQLFISRLDRVAGTLDHANSLSMYLCLTVPPLVAAAFAGWSRPLRWFCALAAALGALGVLLTYSRAGIPILAVVVLGTIATCASWRLTGPRLIVRGALVVCAMAVLAAAWPKIEQRYGEATFQEEYFDPTVDGRGIYLRLASMIATDHFFGVGLNNWSYHVSQTYGPRLGFKFVDYGYLGSVYGTDDAGLYADANLAAPAHNLAALTLGELGVPGLVLFAILWGRWFLMGAAFLRLPRVDPMRVLGVGIFFAIAGIFGQSLTEWVYRQTPILFTFHILLGALAGLTEVRRRRRSRRSASVGDGSGMTLPCDAIVEGGSRPAAMPALRAGILQTSWHAQRAALPKDPVGGRPFDAAKARGLKMNIRCPSATGS
ncbi:MAG: O-antigen ligase family protein [Opitutaceae bacterium]|nr:O-antigen ligase family protein [Opitutaceae bacterium]